MANINKAVNLCDESRKEFPDLNLCLGNSKGKRPIDGSTETNKRQKLQEDFDDDSIAHSFENKFAFLEQKLEDLENLINRRADEQVAEINLLEHKLRNLENLLNRRVDEQAVLIDKNFMFISKCLYDQQNRYLECISGVQNNLHQLTLMLAPRSISELQRFTISLASSSKARPSSSKAAPSSSKQKSPLP